MLSRFRKLREVMKDKTRDQWCAIMEGSDVCFAPVLDLDEAPHHPHNEARRTFVDIDGIVQPSPAPRFSRTQPEIQGPPPLAGEHTREVLTDWGIPEDDLQSLIDAGAVNG